jgi:uncharacterized lipoprotein YmbA
MKTLALLILSLLIVGCAKPEPVAPTYVPPVVKEQTVPQEVAPVQPPKHYSSSYIRGYNDGYDGNWLSPANWLVRGDYRAGWSAGERDRKNKLPNKFN